MNAFTRRLALTASIAATSCVTMADDFKVTVQNLGPQPLSPVFVAASDVSFNIFSLGGAASLGIKNIAEMGDATAMLGIAGGAGTAVSDFGIPSGGPIVPGDSRTLVIHTDSAHPYFSFAAMLGKTNDGFIGESVDSMGLMLYSAGVPIGWSLTVSGARAWDAGTELNTQDSLDLAFKGGAGNPADSDSTVRVHGGVVAGIGDSWMDMPNWTTSTNLATISVTPVPEPTTLAALAIGGVLALRRRKG